MYKITTPDGTKIENLSINGTNYVSQTKIDTKVFDQTLEYIIISDGENAEMMHNVELIQQVHYEDGWYICFRELTQQELNERQMNSDITDIQMAMSDLYEEDGTDITDVQMALAEIYEMLGG